ncbi:ATP-binding protein [Micromonospora sp. WMMD882]|uniref:ATP-binding protein n=1 Tax=Micromonospora sp. WMMD882 TaxID=3015151 RepID=UPI00248ABF97|nr:ATP-binding protein [Micromonospora sp. WMMD882]WBB81171.1 ATP-binding protein [Micromonospora sp. WMMD882]
MSRQLTYQVREDPPVTVVRFAGTLDRSTMTTAQRALDRCLAAQPDALVVDLARLAVRDRSALSVFGAAARQAADWPAVPMVLCAPPPEAASWLAADARCPVVPVRRDYAEATREVRDVATPRLRVRLQPVADACRRARELTQDACGRWNVPQLVGPTSLVLSELVGNVVRHAGTPMQVTLTLRRPYLHVAVADGSRAAARPASPGPDVPGGRGLLLVRELTQRWGTAPAGDGKVVWALLPAV